MPANGRLFTHAESLQRPDSNHYLPKSAASLHSTIEEFPFFEDSPQRPADKTTARQGWQSAASGHVTEIGLELPVASVSPVACRCIRTRRTQLLWCEGTYFLTILSWFQQWLIHPMPISARTAINTTIGLLCLAFLILAGIVGMNVWLSERVEVYAKIITENRDIRTSAVDMRSALQTAESSQRGFLVLGNEIYLAPFDSAKLAAERELKHLQSLIESSDQRRAMMLRLSNSVDEKFAEMQQTVKLKRESRSEDALELFRTNRGKVLMDEINVFLSSIIRNADANMTGAVIGQKNNTNKLQLASSLGGFLILIIVGAVIYVGVRYTRDIASARDEVNKLNTTLELRVESRTADLGRALSRAELLLSEVNHRVANSLALVASLVKLQAKSVTDVGARTALAETESRIFAIADVHKRLYNSGDVEVVALNEYLEDLLSRLDGTMKQEGLGSIIRTSLEPIALTPDASVNIGVVLNEWVTNAFKYAYPGGGGEIRVTLKRIDKDRGELVVEDDGVGMKGAAIQGTGLGSKLVSAMATNLKGEIRYADRTRGTSAHMAFPILA